MSCDSPILAEFVGSGRPLKIYGPLERFLSLQHSAKHMFMKLPCGKCLSCRMSQARMWSVRCAYELQEHTSSCFVTLTYNNEHLPDGDTLWKPDYQMFFKRLRKRIAPIKIRYFGCGEYGSLNFRPHYHFIIFGWSPPDLEPFFCSGGNVVYRSKFLESVWSNRDHGFPGPLGFVTVGDVTEDSIKYVCRYTLKKLTQELSDEVCPPFTVASSRPAIGRTFFLKFFQEAVVKSENGDILRYGFPDPFNPGSFLDVRYYRKFLPDLIGEDSFLDLRRWFCERALDCPVDGSELFRRQEFSKVRLSHNTHYGRILPQEEVEEIEKWKMQLKG